MGWELLALVMEEGEKVRRRTRAGGRIIIIISIIIPCS